MCVCVCVCDTANNKNEQLTILALLALNSICNETRGAFFVTCEFDDVVNDVVDVDVEDEDEEEEDEVEDDDEDEDDIAQSR